MCLNVTNGSAVYRHQSKISKVTVSHQSLDGEDCVMIGTISVISISGGGGTSSACCMRTLLTLTQSHLAAAATLR